MQNRNNDSSLGAVAVRSTDSILAAFPFVTTTVAVLMSIAIASQCSAQTLNLGPDSSYGIFVNGGGTVSMSGGVVNGNMDLGAGVKPKVSGGTLNGHTNSNVTAAQVTLPSGNAGAVGLNNTYSAATSGAVTIFNLKSLSMSAGQMVLNGVQGAGDTFIFNVSGSLSLSGGTMILHNIDASHVIFIGNNISISGGTIDGTFYDSSSSGNISMSGGNLTGALVGGNGGGLSISGGTITAHPFAAAPETPTIMTAGLAAFLIMGSSGIRYLRRRRRASCVELTAH
jgi:hypothetical protein